MSWKMLAGVVILVSLLGGMKYLFDRAEKNKRPKN
jgi:hypothetical protein